MASVRRLRGELQLARREIRQGQFQRSMVLVTGVAAVLSGFEAYLQHQRGAFKDPFMWTPVALTPPTVLVATAAVFNQHAAIRFLRPLSLAWLVDGLIGTALHVRGILRLPGGIQMGQYNVVIGPPIFAPMLSAMVGVLGLCAGLLRTDGAHPVLSPYDTVPGDAPGIQFGKGISREQFQQAMAVVTAAFGALAGGEAYFEHLRGSFNQRWMWTPVWLTPPIVVAALAATRSTHVAERVLPILSMAVFADGVMGFLLHLRGVKRMPGHFTNLRFNLVMGPPMFAPLLLCSVGLLGMITSMLKGTAE